ncbi:unnamed protein product [Brassica oleracea]
MAPTIKTIGEYKTHQDYFVDFFGDNLSVTQTETPSVIRRWIRYVVYRHRRSRSRHPLVVGVGVQWTPRWYFSAPKGYYRPADTLQLCVGTLCLIIQLSYCKRVPHILRRFLTDPNTTFVVSPSLLHQLLWTEPGRHSNRDSLHHQALDPRRRLPSPSPSLAFFSPSRRWSRRPVDTVMVLLTTGVRPSSGYTPAMRGNISSHRPALLLSARPQHPSTFPHESGHDFCRFLEQPRREKAGNNETPVGDWRAS